MPLPNTEPQLILNAFLMSTGHHEASWRLPESDPAADASVEHFQQLARIAERGKMDRTVRAGRGIPRALVGLAAGRLSR